MLDSTALLISSDPSLVKVVKGVAGSIAHLGLEVMPELAPYCPSLRRDGVALVLIHLPQGGDLDAVAGLLQIVAASRRPIATLVLSDDYQAAQTLALLRQGAVAL